MRGLFILILFVKISAFGSSSCKEKLQEKVWPLDCFLALKINKQALNSRPYQDLGLWCSTFKEELFKHRPPKALFSLPLSQKCRALALLSEEHHKAIDLLRGDFLNSFL